MKKISVVCVFWVILQPALYGQAPLLDTLVGRFSRYREKSLTEKIYAHLDRTFYLTGETMWFKLYAVDGSFHQPLSVSSVAYVELLDRSNFPVLQAKVEMKDGRGTGSFYLPASLSSGNYKLRAYTNWMKNFGAEFFFHAEVSIVNPFVVPEAHLVATSPRYTLDFFPEGGNLVSGIRTKVGFRMVDDYGRGIAGQGFVVNDRRDTLARFKAGKFGLGHFFITASDSEPCKAVLIGPGGVRTVHNFPGVYPNGYALQLIDSGQYLYAKVSVRGVADREVFLFVHARQRLAYAGTAALGENGALFQVKKSDLDGGISHFTLFNEKMDPVCERLYFTYPGKALRIDLATNQKVYAPRHKVSVTIRTAGDSLPVPANLSVSVYRMDSLGHEPVGIYPYWWLTSDLTGVVESPGYYFRNPTAAVRRQMDDLMLTHGWRRFSWDAILNEKTTLVHLPEMNGHIITGIVSRDGKPRHGVFTYLGSPGKIVRAYGSWSNMKGEVQYEIKDFYGPRKIILLAQSDSTQRYEIRLNNPFSTAYDSTKLPLLVLDPSIREPLENRSIAMQVQDIYYYEQYGNRFATPVVDSVAFYGKADATYFLDDYTRFPVMEEVMREYVPGVFVRKRKDGFHFVVVDIQNKGVLNGDPMVLLDGVPVPDADDIMKVDPLTVRKLEVVQREYFVGQAVFSGIVSYTTYKGDLGNLQLDPRSISLNYEGLQLRREFYSPQYNYQERTSRKPDQRHLLYWNSDISTNVDGEAQFDFYTSDADGQYVIVVQGMDDEGYAGTATTTFTTSMADD